MTTIIFGPIYVTFRRYKVPYPSRGDKRQVVTRQGTDAIRTNVLPPKLEWKKLLYI